MTDTTVPAPLPTHEELDQMQTALQNVGVVLTKIVRGLNSRGLGAGATAMGLEQAQTLVATAIGELVLAKLEMGA